MWDDDHYVLLLSPQCPATWGLPALPGAAPHDANVLRLQDLLHVAEDAWATLVVRLLLSHELALQGDAAAAREHLEQCRYVLRGVVADAGGLVKRTRPALRHVLRAAFGHLDTASTASSEAAATSTPTEDLLQLDRRQVAAIWGLRACALRLYGCEGWQEAHDCAERAVGLDMEEPAWLHLLGLHRRDPALLKEGGALAAPRPALHWAAAVLWDQGRAGAAGTAAGTAEALHRAVATASEAADGRPACAMTQTQAALLLRLGAGLLRRHGHGDDAAKAKAEACARKALALAPQCVLVQAAAAAVLDTHPKRQHRDALQRLYGVEWTRALAMLREYSFGLVYLMARPV